MVDQNGLFNNKETEVFAERETGVITLKEKRGPLCPLRGRFVLG